MMSHVTHVYRHSSYADKCYFTVRAACNRMLKVLLILSFHHNYVSTLFSFFCTFFKDSLHYVMYVLIHYYKYMKI